jgi:endonuclease YncB( thermonuclease family)
MAHNGTQMAHDFIKFPELTNNQLELYYWDSPHKQILDDFTCRCVGVKDGDTIEVEWVERDFLFPVRLSLIAAPELNEAGGRESLSWLRNRIEGRVIDIEIDPSNRVGKWGRLLGVVHEGGSNINLESIFMGKSILFSSIKEGGI